MKLDKYFQALYNQTGNIQDLIEAGWMDKILDVDFNLNSSTTPIETIKGSAAEEASVLFYPGCYAPVHEGHVGAMRLAKETVEATGETVVAGFFTPDHDDYIMRKTNNDERFIASNRIRILNETIKDDPWMHVDTWAALTAPTDLNFTTLYDRLDTYLKQHVPNKKVKIYMVFGGDNYLFANTFVEHGYGVCVGREGVNIDLQKVQPEAQQRVLFSQKACPNFSSSAIRASLNV